MSRTVTLTRRVLAVASLVAAALLAVASFGAAPADAFTFQQAGCPGSVDVPRTNGYSWPAFEFPQRQAFRAPCNSQSTQVISARYRLWAFNLQTRQWQYYTELRRSATVPPGYSVRLMGWSGGSTWANISADVLVEWRLTNGAFIGSTYINYDSVGDYGCPLGTPCRVYSDPVVGAYLHLT